MRNKGLACQPVEAHGHIIQQKQKCLNRSYPSTAAPRNGDVSSSRSHQQRWPKMERLQVGSTTLTYQQATQKLVMHQSAQHGAMLPSLLYQGIVLHLLPFLPSPHSCIKRSTVYGGDMTCSSFPIWSYIARVSSVSPGNTKRDQACNIPISDHVQHATLARLECHHQYARPLSSYHPAVWTYLWRASLWVQQESTSQVLSPLVGSVRDAIAGQDRSTWCEHHTFSSSHESHSQRGEGSREMALARLFFSLQTCVDHLDCVLAGCCWKVQVTRLLPSESLSSLQELAKCWLWSWLST